jgi:lipocalin
MLAKAYDKLGNSAEAVHYEGKAVEIAREQHDLELEKTCRILLQRYQRNGNQQPAQ